MLYTEKDSIRTIWEFINMSFQEMSEEILDLYHNVHEEMMEINVLCKKIATLPISESKDITIRYVLGCYSARYQVT